MAVKKKGRLEGSPGDAGSSDLLYSAQQIWQAGLGALARAQAGAPKAFEDLMREGRKLQGGAFEAAQGAVLQALRDARRTVGERVESAREQAGESWEGLEKVFQSRVQRALGELGVPAAEELDALRRRVEALEKRAGKPEPRSGRRVSRKGGPKRSSGRARRRSTPA